MTAAARLNALKEKHDSLDKNIKEEMKHPSMDSVLVEKLKKQKLKLKEEIAQMEKEEG